ncbi:hypothetical protein SteCoe_30463 [Stentor coeruleus]|uniref:Palmitoyltransferase n=1 Tax=Stentor coeruleus TaxID=5963 RepID=A0A1R2B3W0_9CILI|nr:hypothetical protein SteCoe_30463 [Stentor coeruleus]
MKLRNALLQSISDNDINRFVQILSTNESIKQLQDNERSNFLHELATFNRPIIFYYLKLANIIPNALLLELLNQKSIDYDGMTPLQLSIQYNKKIRPLVFLNTGSDPHVLDEQGRTCMHLAVRSNNIALFVKLYELGISLNQADYSGNTPLHLSLLERREEFSLLIVSLSIALNIRGENGKTPLHLAAELGNYRVCRRLIAYKARVDVLDDEEYLAKDYSLTAEIKKLFSKGPLCEKNQFTKNPAYFLILIGLFTLKFFTIWLFNFYTFKIKYDLQNYPSDIIFIAVSITYFVNITLLLLSSFKNPGTLKKTDKILSVFYIKDLIENRTLESVCITCRIKKRNNSYHCVLCNACVECYDHHCKWINNCVGRKNVKCFTLFLIFATIDVFLTFIGGAKYVIKHSPEDSISFILQFTSIAVSGVTLLIISPITYLQVTNHINSTTSSIRFSKRSSFDSSNSINIQNPQDYFNE